MPTFPKLKSGAVVQYPLKRSRSFSNEVLHFLAGDEQRYRVSSGPLHSWAIQFDLLDEEEMNQLNLFFVATAGSFDSFSFTDPADGTIYPSCNLSSDDLESVFQGELRSSTTLVVRENKT